MIEKDKKAILKYLYLMKNDLWISIDKMRIDLNMTPAEFNNAKDHLINEGQKVRDDGNGKIHIEVSGIHYYETIILKPFYKQAWFISITTPLLVILLTWLISTMYDKCVTTHELHTQPQDTTITQKKQT